MSRHANSLQERSSSNGSHDKEENPGTRLRRVAQELLPPEDRVSLRNALRKYRENNMLPALTTELSRIVISYDRLPIIDAIGDLFPTEPTGDKKSRQEYFAAVDEMIPLYASTKKLSKAAASSDTSLRVRSISVAAMRHPSPGRPEVTQAPSRKERSHTRSKSSDRFSRATSSGNLRDSDSSQEFTNEKSGYGKDQSVVQQRIMSRQSRRRTKQPPDSTDEDEETASLGRQSQGEKYQQRSAFTRAKDRSFWTSQEESLSSGSESTTKSSLKGRQNRHGRYTNNMENRMYYHNSKERLKATSYTSLNRNDDNFLTPYRDDQRPKKKHSWATPVSSDCDSLRDRSVSPMKEEYISIPLERAQPYKPDPCVPVKPVVTVHGSNHLKVSEQRPRPKCLVRSLSSSNEIRKRNSDGDVVCEEKTVSRATQTCVKMVTIGVQTSEH